MAAALPHGFLRQPVPGAMDSEPRRHTAPAPRPDGPGGQRDITRAWDVTGTGCPCCIPSLSVMVRGGGDGRWKRVERPVPVRCMYGAVRCPVPRAESATLWLRSRWTVTGPVPARPVSPPPLHPAALTGASTRLAPRLPRKGGIPLRPAVPHGMLRAEHGQAHHRSGRGWGPILTPPLSLRQGKPPVTPPTPVEGEEKLSTGDPAAS